MRADVMQMPLATVSIDFTVLVNILHLIPGPHAAVRELARVLRPGGAAICVWHRQRNPTLGPLTDAWERATGDLMQFESIDTGLKTLS